MQKIRLLFYSGDGVLKNDHIFKDTGIMIDYFNRHDYDAKIVCIDYSQTIDAPKETGKNIPIKYIRNRTHIAGISLGLLGYIFSVKKLKLLILTHFSPKTFIYALWYRLFQRKGTIYVKGDFNGKWLAHNGGGFINTRFWLVRAIEKLCVRMFFRLINYATVETEEGLMSLHAYDKCCRKKVFLMPNSFDDRFLKAHDMYPRYSEKTNSIVTIGRIGTHQKNNELMLDILKQLELKDWNVTLIGTIEPEFQKMVDQYFERYPMLHHKITFTGPIYDRVQLFNYLRAAKVYLCTSRYEGFSLVFPELISQGCYLVTTPVSGADDVTDHGKLGSILENESDFVHTLQRIIDTDMYSPELYSDITSYAREHFAWEDNLKKLSHLLFGDNDEDRKEK